MLCKDLFTKSNKDKFAYDIYQQLCPFLGRHGFKVRRTSGSSGKGIPETDKNLLYLLCYNEGILPRLACGCVILWAEDRCLFCYAKVSPSLANQHVVWDYTHSRKGGQFDIPSVCITSFLSIAKMIYIKTLAVLILNAYHIHWEGMRQLSVAYGPLIFENESLLIAWDEFMKLPKEEAMYRFLSKFNSCNHYSMVAYPVGIPYDHCKHGKESLEIGFFSSVWIWI